MPLGKFRRSVLEEAFFRRTVRNDMEEYAAPEQTKLKTIDYDIQDRKSTRLNSSHITRSRMPSSAVPISAGGLCFILSSGYFLRSLAVDVYKRQVIYPQNI